MKEWKYSISHKQEKKKQKKETQKKNCIFSFIMQ